MTELENLEKELRETLTEQQMEVFLKENRNLMETTKRVIETKVDQVKVEIMNGSQMAMRKIGQETPERFQQARVIMRMAILAALEALAQEMREGE